MRLFKRIIRKISNCAKDFYCKQSGLATVEYAIVTVAAAAFAGLLIFILKSDTMVATLTNLFNGVLNTK